VPYLSASAVIHYEEALYQVYAPLPFMHLYQILYVDQIDVRKFLQGRPRMLTCDLSGVASWPSC